MAEDDDISRRYRELPREEPPRHLDDAIRAAARRAVHTRPAPLVVPTGRQRWYFPLAAAAIIVLAVAVTMHVEREQPGEEIVSAPAAPAGEKPQASPHPPELQKAPEPAAAPPAPVAAPPPAPPVAAQDAIRGAQESASAPAARPESARVQAEPEPKPMAKAGAAAAPQANAQLRRADEGRRAAPLSAFALHSPEQWLQGIADLRRQGRHEEADKSLAEFRKRYPDYPISKEVLEQVEKR